MWQPKPISRRALLASTGTALASIATAGRATAAPNATAVASATRRKRLAAVKTWGYQLRLLNFAELAASPTDLLVIDHAFSDGLRFLYQYPAADIEFLKFKPDGQRRLVLAYLSIGEAERYRFYWQDAWFNPETKPTWLGEVNPRWAGNYPVDFWDADWQRLIVGGADSYVDRIMAQGFDGIYLDRADVFQELIRRHPKGAKTMANFIARIATAVRAKSPDALVILQNAEELIAERPVRDAIDAIAKEDLYFGLDFSDTRNPAAAINAAERDLKRAQAAGKKIFVVEYVTDPIGQGQVLQRCATQKFLPYFGPRDLRALITDPATLAPGYHERLGAH